MRTEYYRVVIKNTPPSNAPCTVIPIVSVTFSVIMAVVDNGYWLPIAIADIALQARCSKMSTGFWPMKTWKLSAKVGKVCYGVKMCQTIRQFQNIYIISKYVY